MRLTSNQDNAITHLKEWKVGALFMEAGTGKTRTVTELIKMLPNLGQVIWVGPLKTINKESTPLEIKKWYNGNIPFFFYGIESIGLSNRIYLEVDNLLKKNVKSCLVIDESLKIKNFDAKRTKRLLLLSHKAEYRFILNGTPLSKNLLDLWAQMEFLSPKILNMNLTQYKNTFCKYTTLTKYTYNRGRQIKEFITGYENIDYLYSLIDNYIYECNLILNIEQNYTTINYILSNEEKEKYNDIKNYFLKINTLDSFNNNIFLAMTQAMQHSYCCSKSKIECLKDLFKKIRQEDTIIFCKYIDSRIMCAELFPKAKVLSYQKEAYGLNLQQYHNTVYFDKIWDLALRIQSSRRTYRTGQKEDCKYYDLTGDVGLDKLIEKNIFKKVSMLEYIKGKSKIEIAKEL